MPIRFMTVNRVTWNEDRLREACLWATRSIADRVIAGWELAEENLTQPEDHEPEKRAGITLRRISSRGR